MQTTATLLIRQVAAYHPNGRGWWEGSEWFIRLFVFTFQFGVPILNSPRCLFIAAFFDSLFPIPAFRRRVSNSLRLCASFAEEVG